MVDKRSPVVRAGLFGLAQHEHADRPKGLHRDADVRADELLGHTAFDRRARLVETHIADHDRPSFGKLIRPSLCTVKLVDAGLVAVELHFQRIAGSDDVVDGHLDVGHRRKSGRQPFEQIVPEGFERLFSGRSSRSSVNLTE